MENETMRLAFDALQFVLWGGTSFYVYISNKNRVTNDRVTALQNDVDARLEGQSVRVAHLEEAMLHAPTHNDIAKLYEKINDVSTCMNRMEGEFKATNRTLHLIHETMMAGGKQ